MSGKSPAFVVSIEPRGAATWRMEKDFASYVDARTEAEVQWRSGGIVTVAVMQHNKICDVFDGQWSSEYAFDDN